MVKKAFKGQKVHAPDFFRCSKKGHTDEIQLICSCIREVAEDLDYDTKIPEEAKKEMKKDINSLLKLLESEEFAAVNGECK